MIVDPPATWKGRDYEGIAIASAAFVIGVSLVLLSFQSVLRVSVVNGQKGDVSPSSSGTWPTPPLRTWHRAGAPMTFSEALAWVLPLYSCSDSRVVCSGGNGFLAHDLALRRSRACSPSLPAFVYQHEVISHPRPILPASCLQYLKPHSGCESRLFLHVIGLPNHGSEARA